MPEEENVSVAPADISFAEGVSSEVPDAPGEQTEEELNAFKDSLFGGVDLGGELESALKGSDQTEEAGQRSVAEEEASASADEFSFSDMDEMIENIESSSPGEPVILATEKEESIELFEEPLQAAGEHEHVSISFDEPTDAMYRGEDIAAADRFVADGKFFEAMGAYRKFLTADPNNKKVLQRVEELRGLLKLMGKDKEALVAKLDAFLEGINKRRDEFFGRS